MIPLQIILVAIVALITDADECNCQCEKNGVCDEQNTLRADQNELRTKLDVNTAEISKWNRHYDFVRGIAKDWQSQVAYVVRQQVTAGMNETVESFKYASERVISVQNEDLIARMGSLETALRAVNERTAELDLTMEMISTQISGLRTELQQIHPAACSPACKNGGRCMQNNVCNCTYYSYGDRCQDRCGVDFDNGGNEREGSNSDNLVWPWMAAIYKNFNNGPAYVCDGSVIDRHFIVTAAGCIDYYGGDGLTVKLGLSDLKKETHLQSYRVRAYHKHPKFGKYINYDYNVGLLELEEPISFNSFVKPICLPPRVIPQDWTFYKPQSEAKAVVLHSYIGDPQTASPTVVTLTILSPEECRLKLKAVDWEHYYPTPEFSFCAESSSSTCPSDGTPLMQYRLLEDGTRTWTHVGVRTWNLNCKFFFSTRLDHLRPWIEAIVSAASRG